MRKSFTENSLPLLYIQSVPCFTVNTSGQCRLIRAAQRIHFFNSYFLESSSQIKSFLLFETYCLTFYTTTVVTKY